MTENETTHPPADTWDSVLDAMRRRYPGQRDGVLFCIHKLQQDPDLTLRDFRDEAKLYGIPVAGRSLHSARVLLGIARTANAPAAAAAVEPPEPRRARSRQRAPFVDAATIEDKVVAAVRQIQDAAGADAQRLRTAVRQAIVILQKALGE